MSRVFTAFHARAPDGERFFKWSMVELLALRGIVKKALSDALRWKKIVFNPVKDADPPKYRKCTMMVLSEAMNDFDRLFQGDGDK